ncbi:phosphoribosylamine--glycine ligase [Blattabacterium cuenoti]|uniref:phosphoribosylamine--glycine ligase n=1 Tax=Blattabacterium cuenoti TaxID=1653831 RepID=UPI00163CD528|nr:phosphoribosylamine--glycine ligase [Blattabacterium cuenoti]
MKVLIIGNGGREQAIGKKLLEDNPFLKLYFYPGNGGTKIIGKNIDHFHSLRKLVCFAKKENINITIVGSEMFLMEKIVDMFHYQKLQIFGPHYQASRLEGDRSFSKNFMKKYGIRTPDYHTFRCYQRAENFFKNQKGSFAIKTNGLAYGKGVILVHNQEEAKNALKKIMIQKKFGKSGETVIIEEFLTGIEATVISIFNGKKIIPLLSSKDYKKIGENETGLNTGGMGCIAPHPSFNDSIWKDFKKNILTPTLEGLRSEKLNFLGFLYFGLMIHHGKVYLLEYNTRMGDPEAQTLFPLMNNNLLEVFNSVFLKKEIHFVWKKLHSCCIVLSSHGYPLEYEHGKVIYGIDSLKEPFYISGMKKIKETWITSGGRVLNIVGLGNSIKEARNLAYDKIKNIKFENMYFRKDIGKI